MKAGTTKVNRVRVPFPVNNENRVPAIGGGYAWEEIAIVENYWTFHAMKSTLRKSMMSSLSTASLQPSSDLA